MQHLIENISYFQNKFLLKGFIFGVVHVGIMLLGFYTGWSINRFLKLTLAHQRDIFYMKFSFIFLTNV